MLTVPLDKGFGFFVIKEKKSTYRKGLEDVLKRDQFKEIYVAEDEILIKTEKNLTHNLKQLMKQGQIKDRIHQGVRSIGSQPVRNFERKDTQKIRTSPTSSFNTWQQY